jgi:Fur family ferric uptake transcriptional regulator
MDIKKIFIEKGIKATKNRLLITAYVYNSSKAVSLHDMHLLFINDMDRATVYRTLDFLAKNSILKKIANSKGINLFTVNSEINAQFKCNNCDSIELLPEIPDEYKAILKNKNIKNFNVTIEGTCSECE